MARCHVLVNINRAKMQFGCASLITASLGLLFVSCHILVIKGNHGNALQQMFADRTKSDWEAAWHVEKHRRCYQELTSHMELVCRHDIYNMLRKRNKRPTFELEQSSASIAPSGNSKQLLRTKSHSSQEGIFLTALEASSMWRTGSPRRSMKRSGDGGGIMDECCTDVGCSWEEYAEYCPTNRRMRNRS